MSPITVDDINAADARSAGYGTPEEVIADLRPEGQLYRIRFRRVGDDPRIALRQQADVDESTLAAVERLPWAGDVLRAIAAHPATVSTTLAAQLGMERQPFKQRVRRLKSLGLTESLEVGYRLSPEARRYWPGSTDSRRAAGLSQGRGRSPVGSREFTDGGSGNAGA